MFGQLKDDYYMHKIIIQSPTANITVTKNSIILDNKQIHVWQNGHTDIITKYFEYSIGKEEILIKFANDYTNKNPINILIKKRNELDE